MKLDCPCPNCAADEWRDLGRGYFQCLKCEKYYKIVTCIEVRKKESSNG